MESFGKFYLVLYEKIYFLSFTRRERDIYNKSIAMASIVEAKLD